MNKHYIWSGINNKHDKKVKTFDHQIEETKENKWPLLFTKKTKYDNILDIKDQTLKMSTSEIAELFSLNKNN